MAESRITELAAKGMLFDDPPSPEVVARINALLEPDYLILLNSIVPSLTGPSTTGPTLHYQNGGFQFRAFEK